MSSQQFKQSYRYVCMQMHVYTRARVCVSVLGVEMLQGEEE